MIHKLLEAYLRERLIYCPVASCLDKPVFPIRQAVACYDEFHHKTAFTLRTVISHNNPLLHVKFHQR